MGMSSGAEIGVLKLISMDEMYELIDKITAEIPLPILKGLNGGIILMPGCKLHPKSVNSDLYIMGEYSYQSHGLGRIIYIYYGSIERLYGYASNDTIERVVREVIYHELTHHLENQAGDRSLEVEDAVNLRRYLNRHGL